MWSLEPPEPINTKLYWCDQQFVLEPLKKMVVEKEVYGLIVLDSSEADIGIVKGKKIEILKHLTSIVPGKTSKGGWSQQRYARVREGLLNDFLKEVGNVASEKLKEYPELKGIIIGGPGMIKDQFASGDYLVYDIKNKILGVVDTSYTGEYGLEETVNRAADLISQASIIKEKEIMNKFFTELKKDTGLAIYGFKEVIDALNSGNMEILLISEGFNWIKVKLKCSCGFEIEKIIKEDQKELQKCPKCGSKLEVLEEKEILEEIIEQAEKIGAQVEMISIDTREGEQLKELGGIAGILRYKRE